MGAVGFIGSQIFAPARLGYDPAEQRYLAMMSKGGNQNHAHTDLAHLSDEEIEALLRDPKTSESDKKKLREQQKVNKDRNRAKRGVKKQKAAPVKNDPASVRARQNAGAAPTPTSTQDNSTVTTTQQDNLPQPKKDPQQ